MHAHTSPPARVLTPARACIRSRTKKQLAQQLVDVEATLQKERRERAAMEEALTEAYSATLREMVELQEAAAAGGPRGGGRPGGGAAGRIGLVPAKLNFR